MALSPEDIAEVKEQLRDQVANLQEPQRTQALSQIDSLSPEAVESLVEQQKSQNTQSGEKTIFRMIVDKEVESVRILENDHAVAVFDINPISKGHTLILPKLAVKDNQDLSKEVLSFAKKISEKLHLGLKAKKVDQHIESKFGEKIISLIPIYDAQLNLSSPRKKTTKQELESLLPELEPPQKIEVIKIEKKAISADSLIKLKRRMP